MLNVLGVRVAGVVLELGGWKEEVSHGDVREVGCVGAE